MAIITELIAGFEGYGPVEEDSQMAQLIPGITHYGYFPVEDNFSIVYKEIEQPDNTIATFSFIVDKADAISLEYVLKEEIVRRSWRSETYYCETVFLTRIWGDMPLISFPYRGFSIRFRYNNDYDELLSKVTEFLDSTSMSKELLEKREMLKNRLSRAD
jgi:hypothetical protein